ncbi:MAG: hypothetical protein EOP54_11380 [Sphingobacteriales bacterium]|nr:MAG: hypothetical protein EOP54_11380 [Sphingobacteriales bacterium]
MKKLCTLLLSLCYTATLCAQSKPAKDPAAFIPKGYVLFEQVSGDLNKDGFEDKVLIIKGTDKSKVIRDEYRGTLDRNRRGIIILLDKKDHYALAVKNYDCFSSEHEDGGVYFAPELSVEIRKDNLYIHYGHGRYGYWRYTFRLKDADFELIGYDESNGGAVISSETSINFLTKKKLERVNTNPDAQSDAAIFKETRSNITLQQRLKLSMIKDFDKLSISYKND